MSTSKIAIITAIGLIGTATVILLAFTAKDIFLESPSEPNMTFSEKIKIVPNFYKQNVVVNATFNKSLLIPLYVQTSGPSQRLSDLSIASTFVTLGLAGGLAFNFSGSINGNVTAYDPCVNQWNCKTKQVPSIRPPNISETVTITIPTPTCSGVQECIANGNVAYCDGSQGVCDDLCMKVDIYATASQCANPLLVAPSRSLLYRMSECSLHPDSISHVKYIPADITGIGAGYLEQKFADSNCLILIQETWYKYECNEFFGQFRARYQPSPCSEACGEDGYGCQSSSPIAPPKIYCPMTQQCKANGGSPSCGFTGGLWEGKCNTNSACGDGYGCAPRPFGDGSSSSAPIVNLYAPDLDCPQTQNCINNGHTPICKTNVGSGVFNQGSCESICLVQRYYKFNCSGIPDRTVLTQAYSCQPAFPNLNKEETTLYWRVFPQADQTMLYEEYTDSGCTEASRQIVLSETSCYTPPYNFLGSYTFEFANCESVCDDFGCPDYTKLSISPLSPFTVSTSFPIETCANTQRCIDSGRVPWCQSILTYPANTIQQSRGRCDQICILASREQSTNTITIAPYQCVEMFSTPPQPRLWTIFRGIIPVYDSDGSPGTWGIAVPRVQMELYLDPFCQTMINSSIVLDGSVYFETQLNVRQCNEVPAPPTPGVASTCSLTSLVISGEPLTGYLPTIDAKCYQGAPICTTQGQLDCKDMCWGYKLEQRRVFNNVGPMATCVFDRVVRKYARLDFFGFTSVNSPQYVLRYYDDPFCFRLNATYGNEPNPIPNDFNLVNNVRFYSGRIEDINLFVGECEQFNNDYSPACYPIYVQVNQSATDFYTIPDYGHPSVLECTGNGLAPVCQLPALFQSQWDTNSKQMRVHLACIDLTLIERDYNNVPRGAGGSDGCESQQVVSFNPPVIEQELQMSCFWINNRENTLGTYTAVPVTNGRDDFDILLFEWDKDQVCGSSFLGENLPLLIRNGDCYFDRQLWIGPTDYMNDEFLCKSDGYGCGYQWSIDAFSGKYNTFLRPRRYCPSTQSCWESGRSPICADRDNGYCQDTYVWAETFSETFGEPCPDGKAQLAIDFKGPTLKIGQCQEVFDVQDYTNGDFPVFAQSFIPHYYSVPLGNNLVAFEFFVDPACTVGYVQNYYWDLNWPFVYVINQCFGGSFLTDSQTWKVGTGDVPCQYDGYGCPQEGNNGNSNFPCTLATCKPQFSCETTRSCMATDGFSNEMYIFKALCYVQAGPTFSLQMGSCAWIPFALSKNDTRVPHNGTHIFLGPNITTKYSKELEDRLNSPKFKEWIKTPEVPGYQMKHLVSPKLMNQLIAQSEERRKKKRQVIDCTIGAALVYSQVAPTTSLNITGGEVLYIPTKNVIYGQVHAINFDGVMPFEYLSSQDSTWQTVVTNVGEGVYLLAETTCSEVLVSGTFNYDLAFN